MLSPLMALVADLEYAHDLNDPAACAAARRALAARIGQLAADAVDRALADELAERERSPARVAQAA